MPDIETDVSPEAMARANETNYAATMALLARAYGGEVRDEPDLLWYATGLPISFLNGVIRCNLAPETVDERIAWVIEQARTLGIAFGWRIGPSTRPAGLGSHLARHGLVDGGETPAMGIELARLPEMPALPAGVTIEQVRDPDSLRQWAYTSAVGFGLPQSAAERFQDVITRDPLSEDSPKYYLARTDGAPVATSAITLVAGVAGLYSVATLEQARGQGIGAAVTQLPLLAARDLGYRIGILQASAMGYPIYARLGFHEHFRYRTYYWEPS